MEWETVMNVKESLGHEVCAGTDGTLRDNAALTVKRMSP